MNEDHIVDNCESWSISCAVLVIINSYNHIFQMIKAKDFKFRIFFFIRPIFVFLLNKQLFSNLLKIFNNKKYLLSFVFTKVC